MSMYIRLKRKSQTVFLHVEPSNTFLQLKQRIAEIFSIADPAHIMLVASDKVRLSLILHSYCFTSPFIRQLRIQIPLSSQKKELMDLATLSDQEIQNDDIVYMVFAKENGVGWEELQADVFTTFGQDDVYPVN